ncbi:MAG TPA: hypothetical protein V6C58_04345 [Allocoleopsis sp.]|jgi:hypothetical protein
MDPEEHEQLYLLFGMPRLVKRLPSDNPDGVLASDTKIPIMVLYNFERQVKNAKINIYRSAKDLIEITELEINGTLAGSSWCCPMNNVSMVE